MPKARKRNSKNFAVIDVAGSLALSTLADNTISSQALTSSTLTEDYYCISCDLAVSVRGLTGGEGHPMTVEVHHSDYSAAEVLEKLDGEFLGPGNKIEQERSRRLVRELTTLRPDGPGVSTVFLSGKNDNGGPIIRRKIKFMIDAGRTLDIGIWNRSGAALTTGATLEWQGKLYGRWVY